MLVCGKSFAFVGITLIPAPYAEPKPLPLAPTGAVSILDVRLVWRPLKVLQGKTDVAMLTVLRVISQHLNTSAPSSNMAGAVQRDKFKIIYV